jgi:cyclic pyranopterin phosphate synthase
VYKKEMKMSELTHFNEAGEAVMVDVSEKQDTIREALATGSIFMTKECLDKIKAGEIGKGDVLAVARVAGIMGTKKTPDLIPLCHRINLTKAEISFAYESENGIRCDCRVKCVGRTGAEMEALTGVSTALLTIYDMCKAVDKRMEIGNIHLCAKSGGKSGDFLYEG